MDSNTVKASLRAWMRWKQWHKGRDPEDKNVPSLLYGNWETLLDFLCEGSLDLTDQLFTQLESGRLPALAHHYLAFLQQKLTMPLILTTNFDTFIEQVFQRHWIATKIFDVHRDASLPDPAIVR